MEGDPNLRNGLSRAAVVATVLLVTLYAQSAPRFRAEVALVHVDAEVRDKDGRIPAGLTQSDFRVFDDGQEQVISGFSADEQPLDLVLLFDTSASMRSKVEKVAASSRQALRELRRGDRVQVITFSDSTRLNGTFTDDLSSVERNIQSVLDLHFEGSTYIQQAVDDSANFFLRERRSQRRRAILIVTDNMGRPSRREISVIHDLWEADTVLSGFLVPKRWFDARPKMAGGIDRFVEQTGGDIIRSGDPESAFPEMMRRIRARYSLYYRVPDGTPGSYRSIRVELASDTEGRFPGARVIARRGYRCGESR